MARLIDADPAALHPLSERALAESSVVIDLIVRAFCARKRDEVFIHDLL